MILALCKRKGFTAIDIETVNDVRKKYLKEPPLKSISKASGIARMLDLFKSIYDLKFS